MENIQCHNAFKNFSKILDFFRFVFKFSAGWMCTYECTCNGDKNSSTFITQKWIDRLSLNIEHE